MDYLDFRSLPCESQIKTQIFYVGSSSVAGRHFISHSEAEEPTFCISTKEISGCISITTLDLYHPSLWLYNIV